MPPHLEIRTLKMSAVPRATAASASGKPAERLVEHHRDAQPRPELGQGIDLRVRHGLLQRRRAEPPQRLDPLDQLGRRPRLVGVEPDIHPPAEDPPQRPQPARIVLPLGADLDLHLVEPVDPDLHGRAPLAQRRLGRDRPAVADGLRRRVPLEPFGRRPARRPGPPTRRTESAERVEHRQLQGALRGVARHAAGVGLVLRDPQRLRAAGRPRRNRPAGRSGAAQSCADSSSKAVSTVSPVTYGRGTPSP